MQPAGSNWTAAGLLQMDRGRSSQASAAAEGGGGIQQGLALQHWAAACTQSGHCSCRQVASSAPLVAGHLQLPFTQAEVSMHLLLHRPQFVIIGQPSNAHIATVHLGCCRNGWVFSWQKTQLPSGWADGDVEGKNNSNFVASPT